jgi:hypothetical protein
MTRHTAEYFERYRLIAVEGPRMTTWKMEVVIDQVLGFLAAQKVPGEVAIGTDARFAISVLRMLPICIRDEVLANVSPRLPPAVMQQ